MSRDPTGRGQGRATFVAHVVARSRRQDNVAEPVVRCVQVKQRSSANVPPSASVHACEDASHYFSRPYHM